MGASLEEEIKKRRTFAIISHPDAGKTTLTEKFLLYGGAINTAGSVKGKANSKYAVSDWMEIVEANQKSGKVYADMTLVDKESSANYVYAINGQNMYAKIQFTANNSMEVVVKDGKGYYKNQAGQWVESPSMGESLKQGSTAITPVAGNIVVAPEYKIEATGETMYAETIVSNGQEIAYCFNGDKLAYIVTTVEGQTITLKVNKWENNYDQAIQDKLDLKA